MHATSSVFGSASFALSFSRHRQPDEQRSHRDAADEVARAAEQEGLRVGGGLA